MNGAIRLAGAITIAGARAIGLRALGTVLIAGAWLAMAPPAHAQGTLPQISIESGADIDEGDNAIFTLSRTGGTAAELAVKISVREEFSPFSTADKPDRAQTPLPESVTFAVGSAQATLSLPTIDDALFHAGIRIIAEIESDTGYALGTASEASLIAREDDPLTMQFYIRAPDEIEEGAPSAGLTAWNSLPISSPTGPADRPRSLSTWKTERPRRTRTTEPSVSPNRAYSSPNARPSM